jgi:hypothetical protein
VSRRADDFVGRANLDDVAQIHNGSPSAEVADSCYVMRDEEIGKAKVLLQLNEQVQDHRSNGQVQGGGGFVQHDKRRSGNDCSGYAYALLLSTRELSWSAIHLVRTQADALEDTLNALTPSPPREPRVDYQRLLDDRSHGHPRIQAL